jgi:hydrogenase maturation protein HypF
MQRLRLVCRGVVQGVGFRPAVHRLARELGLRGSIENHRGAVLLDLWGARGDLERLVVQLPAALPVGARLEPLQPQWLPPGDEGPQQLCIGASGKTPLAAGWLAQGLVPDLAPCSACLAELADPGNRRHRYPFISCSSCGPRYSIAIAEPYCRAHTTLADFRLCAACQAEFDDPGDRRFHAETIACPRCGPRLQWIGPPAPPGAVADPLARAVTLLRAGGILALQGVGGFQLLVDATNTAAVTRLRRRKGRPSKPLALLLAEPAPLEPWLRISAAERRFLHSPQAPIVLLRRRDGDACPLSEAVAPGCAELGIMLPASPLHWLLATEAAVPLVATSGNCSGRPLAHTLAEALTWLCDPMAPIADGVLLHDRAVARPLDDSVLRCIDGQPQLLRRARGYAPGPLPLPAPGPAVLALGGDLNSAPALALGQQAWLAPPLGDLTCACTQARWQAGLDELVERSAGQLVTVCSDGHPGYLSRQWAQALCRARPALQHCSVQHHQAHALAVLAEHGRRPPALALAFDGLGHGPGAVPLWGGEGLLIDADGGVSRDVCLRPFALPGAALAVREPRRAALGLLAGAGAAALAHGGAAATLAAFAPGERQLLLQALASGCQSPLCSSVGRLFDGVASLLDLVQVLSHEGQGGLLLEGAAAAAAQAPVPAYPLPLRPAAAELALPHWWDWQPLLAALLADRAAGVSAAAIALGFHRALITAATGWAVQAAPHQPQPQPQTQHQGKTQAPVVVLCGGCFQNRLLLDGMLTALRRAGLEPLWAQQLPSGDGGLALGQLLAARIGGGCAAAAGAGDCAV